MSEHVCAGRRGGPCTHTHMQGRGCGLVQGPSRSPDGAEAGEASMGFSLSPPLWCYIWGLTCLLNSHPPHQRAGQGQVLPAEKPGDSRPLPEFLHPRAVMVGKPDPGQTRVPARCRHGAGTPALPLCRGGSFTRAIPLLLSLPVSLLSLPGEPLHAHRPKCFICPLT